jgi:tetratricopeptide (TPR) repeat protein/tRNA A-37 threonylcarbamoyl transferase component Bud32/DNA-directed RNA polymerase subunit RPC12/RpoP
MDSNQASNPPSLHNPDFDFELAREVLQKGYATKEQIQECLKEKHRLSKTGQNLQLGQVLVRHKYLTIPQLLQLLPKKQEAEQSLECSGCQSIFNVSQKEPGSRIRCKKCQTILVVPPRSTATVSATVSHSSARTVPVSSADTIALLKNSQNAPISVGAATAIPAELESVGSAGGETKIQERGILGKASSSSGGAKNSESSGRIFGKYEILEEIARGGMGIVYKARQLDLKRVVALKVLKQGEFSTEEQIKRFKREAQSAARLNHPSIIPIHEIGIVDGNHYFTMDYIEGASLHEIIKEKTLPLKKIISLLKEIGRGLAVAHQQKIVHRDLKPANIILDREGNPKIADFGLAKQLDQDHLTQSNAVVGTPYYMSPEQTRGESLAITPLSDVYALGVLGYHLLTRKLPFSGNTTMEIYHKINNTEAKPPHELSPKVDKVLSAIVLKAMARDPQKRYASALAFVEELERYENKEKVLAYQADWLAPAKKFLKNTPLVLSCLIGLFLLLGVGLWQKVKSDQETQALLKKRQEEALIQQKKEEEERLKAQELLALKLEEAQRKQEEEELKAKSLAQTKEYETRLAEGDSFRAVKEYAKAITCYQRCLQLFPGNPTPLALKGISHYHLLQYREAIQTFKELLEVEKNHPEGLYWMAFSYQSLEEWESAIPLWTQLIGLNAKDVRYYQGRSEAFRNTENWALAIQDLRVAMNLNPKDAWNHYNLATIYTFKQRDYPEAIQAFNKCLELDSKMLIARWNRGVAYGLNKQFEESIQDFETCYEIDPDYVQRIIEQNISKEQNYSQFGFTAEEVQKNLYNLVSAFQLDEKNPRGFLYLGVYHFYIKEYQKSLSLLNLAIQLDPKEPKGYILRGMCLMESKNHQKAIKDFEYVLKYYPDNFFARLHLAQCYLDLGHYTKSLKEYQSLLERKESVRAHHKIGQIHLINEEYKEALERFNVCLNLNPRYPYALSLKGLILMKIGQSDEALSLTQQAIQIDTENPIHWGILGEIEWSRGNGVAAKAHFEKAIVLQPTDSYFSEAYYKKCLENIR